MSKRAVWRWRDRFLAEGVDGLLRDATRPPGRKPIAEDRVKAPVDLAMSPPGIIGARTPDTGLSRRWPGRLAAWTRQRFATFFAATAPGRTR